jgi:hypothetical protein
VIGSKNSTAMAVLALVVTLLAICLPAPGEASEATTPPVEEQSAEEPSAPPYEQPVAEQPAAQYQYETSEQPSAQYGATPPASEGDAPLGAGGPPTAEVNPEAQYDTMPISPDCGTYEDPCSSNGVADGARPAAEDAQSTNEALGEAHGNDAGIVDASFIDAGLVEEAQAADPTAAPPSNESIGAVFQYGAAPATPTDGYYPTGVAVDPEQIASAPVASKGEVSAVQEKEALAPEEAPSAETEVHVRKAEPPTEARWDSEEARVEEDSRLANLLSTVPLSATGGTLILALGVGALLHRRFSR